MKRELQKEGVFKAIKRKRHFEKPSERKMREENESRRRRRKLEVKLTVTGEIIMARVMR